MGVLGELLRRHCVSAGVYRRVRQVGCDGGVAVCASRVGVGGRAYEG